MKASIHFELETPADFAAFGAIFAQVARDGVGQPINTGVVHAEAPVADKQIGGTKAASKAEIAAAKKAKSDAEKAEADAKAAADKAEADAAEAEALGLVDEGDDPVVEEVTKAMVAKDLRAFIAKVGDTGPKKALEVLKQFGATKFDELKEENYAKFLSALGKAA